jgi:hypothetical protein
VVELAIKKREVTQMDYQAVYNKAHAEGMKAGQSVEVTPMVVSGMGMREVVEGGVCGFAWVNISGRTGFAKWAKAQGIARRAYEGGFNISVMEFGQSMSRKVAYTREFAKVLSAEGLMVSMGSRMD